MNGKRILYKFALPILRMYWHIFKPITFGVKVLILKPQTAEVLLVRHSYGNSSQWNIPGGGYKPAKESAEAAAVREVFEELGIRISPPLKLGDYQTTAEGKVDTVTLFLAIALSDQVERSAEIDATRWVAIREVKQYPNVSTVAKAAIAHLFLN